ncbi:DUF2945 domain-containing protein [Microbacterium xanthum]|uniref:DUF2945 domain-containing protein n=1 Tax=Microbacterium xanthum TaxID=3079794 RepID=UPI002AD4712B|nr:MULTISPECIES: DUF2945 domain-containing protein [unclassified Microbacterium]MDZ8172599.1 DUF2945 domain-containing protein [Microbacterium sp. KSW-48]MDZ8202564.1 DUF2945 domain-containing protein [Microbacterium sp. SSW1-59]
MGERAELHTGDRVSWVTPQGRTRGEVTDIRTTDFTFAGQRFTASSEDPTFIVASEKSGSEAAHKRKALRKIPD